MNNDFLPCVTAALPFTILHLPQPFCLEEVPAKSPGLGWGGRGAERERQRDRDKSRNPGEKQIRKANTFLHGKCLGLFFHFKIGSMAARGSTDISSGSYVDL